VFEAATTAATIVRVRDVAASVSWYRDKLGLEPLHVGSDGPKHPIAIYSIAGSVVSLWQLPKGEERTRDENDRNSYVVAVVDDDLEDLREVVGGPRR
jgi:catechol 2,3-dioxygenase-like lactoylglutathione lyase family enzyme